MSSKKLSWLLCIKCTLVHYGCIIFWVIFFFLKTSVIRSWICTPRENSKCLIILLTSCSSHRLFNLHPKHLQYSNHSNPRVQSSHRLSSRKSRNSQHNNNSSSSSSKHKRSSLKSPLPSQALLDRLKDQR